MLQLQTAMKTKLVNGADLKNYPTAQENMNF